MTDAYFKVVWPQNLTGPFGRSPAVDWQGLTPSVFAKGKGGWDERSGMADDRTEVILVSGTPAQIAAIEAQIGPQLTLAQARVLKAPDVVKFTRRVMVIVAGQGFPLTDVGWLSLNDKMKDMPLFYACLNTGNWAGVKATLVGARDRAVITVAQYNAIVTAADEESIPLPV